MFVVLAVGGFVLLMLLLMSPLLYATRLHLNLLVVDGDGKPQAHVSLGAVRNREALATTATGDGHLTGSQLYAVRDHIGETDEHGRFERTYYFRNFHTIWVGENFFFVSPDLKSSMRQKPHRFDTSRDQPVRMW